MLRKIYRFKKCAFIIGIAVGVILACLVINSQNETSIQMSCKIRDSSEIPYREWLSMQNLKTYPVSYNELGYVQSAVSEASYLYSVVHVHCVVFVKKRRNPLAIRNTWAKRCNEILFFGLENNSDVSVIVLKPKSSWQYLCDAIRYLWQNHKANLHWALFVSDDVFVIPENLRYYVASLDYNKPHYLGEEVTFWGTVYNVGEAGYVLSKGVIHALQRKFDSSESCLKSGKYWRNEDFYLGKYVMLHINMVTDEFRIQ
jgi:glycoprotein-N-acetylgalactosamine 3-beta-galactosyltransferase